MKKQLYIYLLLLCAPLFLSSCSEDDETISELIIGSWKIDNDQTAYRQGLLAGLTGIDEATIETVLSTTSTVFNNSTLSFATDMTGSINKSVIDTDDSNSILGSILGSITNSLIKLNYTYVISNGTIKMTVNGQEYELSIVSITKDEMTVSLTVTDLTDWTSVMLGDVVTNITDTEAFKTIDKLAGQFLGLSVNPTIVMTYYKK